MLVPQHHATPRHEVMLPEHQTLECSPYPDLVQRRFFSSHH